MGLALDACKFASMIRLWTCPSQRVHPGYLLRSRSPLCVVVWCVVLLCVVVVVVVVVVLWLLCCGCCVAVVVDVVDVVDVVVVVVVGVVVLDTYKSVCVCAHHLRPAKLLAN